MAVLGRDDIIHYLTGGNDDELYSMADVQRKHNFGREVYLRAIVEFSNICNKKCNYCGLRAPNSKVSRYRMDVEAIIESACLAAEAGARTIVLQSGDDFSYSPAQVEEIILGIKEAHDVALTLSLGDRTAAEYKHWFNCGADRCLLKLETTDPDIYKRIRCGEDFHERMELLGSLQDVGYEVGSGIIIGLPDYSVEQLADDLLFLTDLELDMIAAGPFIPHPDTPFSFADTGDIDLSFRFTALARLLNPFSNIPATSALDSFDSEGRKKGLQRGCNVIMPSVTPTARRKDYNIYPGKNAVSVDVADTIYQADELIRALGFVPSVSKGSSRRMKNVQ
ncbi:[FeFe] hydrogenase H-cluster radical SAM maturase HydE [Desulfovibrio sp. JC010]|uniref:[FeFe] hydrogenase H-cluster radical SAM maturase HydE n=1 Tax=Desulfovibrio sp. JC010 TaxID=2593641 RepID=UPI0013D807E3|nr:[FeFe] hydrogenase H-cluster radical SAM maturase HydE [Desulfovibrio sp. JC010]NDV28166.1 [FeFe] hydrogenase H-cluster radical SAM maturase HydE [Desulfovibrio sp. JC010]